AELVEVELAEVLHRVEADVAGEADHRLGDVAGQVQPAVDEAAQVRMAARGKQAAEEVAGAVEAVVGRGAGAFGQGRAVGRVVGRVLHQRVDVGSVVAAAAVQLGQVEAGAGRRIDAQ